MRIFDISDNKVVITPEAIAVPHIHKLYDDTNDKAMFFKYIQYIVFTTDWNSPYKAFGDDIRDMYIKSDVFNSKDVIIPDNVLDCMSKHIEFMETPSTRLLKAAEEGIEFLIREYNLLKEKQEQVDKLGKPIVTAEQVGKWLSQLAGAIKSLEALREQVVKEQITNVSRIKGGSELNRYEIRK